MESSHQDETVKPRQFNEQLLIQSIFLFKDPLVAGFLANHGVKDYRTRAIIARS